MGRGEREGGRVGGREGRRMFENENKNAERDTFDVRDWSYNRTVKDLLQC
jgi:hypothetical protein